MLKTLGTLKDLETRAFSDDNGTEEPMSITGLETFALSYKVVFWHNLKTFYGYCKMTFFVFVGGELPHVTSKKFGSSPKSKLLSVPIFSWDCNSNNAYFLETSAGWRFIFFTSFDYVIFDFKIFYLLGSVH